MNARCQALTLGLLFLVATASGLAPLEEARADEPSQLRQGAAAIKNVLRLGGGSQVPRFWPAKRVAAPGDYLRFPVDVERAMLGEGHEAARRLSPPRDGSSEFGTMPRR